MINIQIGYRIKKGSTFHCWILNCLKPHISESLTTDKLFEHKKVNHMKKTEVFLINNAKDFKWIVEEIFMMVKYNTGDFALKQLHRNCINSGLVI